MARNVFDFTNVSRMGTSCCLEVVVPGWNLISKVVGASRGQHVSVPARSGSGNLGPRVVEGR